MDSSEALWLVASVTLPLLLAVGFFRADRRAAKKARLEGELLKAKGIIKREPNDVSPGGAVFEVRATSEDLTLGHSIENPQEIKGEPTLTTDAFVVETLSGKRLTVNAGAKLKVNKLAGAHRKLLDSVTTESGGVEQRFSFEVRAGTTFLLQCRVPESVGDGPFRDAPLTLLPSEAQKDTFIVNPELEVPEHNGVGCLVYPALALAAIAPNVVTDTVFRVIAWIVWVVCVVVAGLGWMIS